MEDKRISEIAEVKLQNCVLKLQLLQMQANYIAKERDEIIANEARRLGCDLNEWVFDEGNNIFIMKPKAQEE